jgi:protein SCO1/2
MSPPTSPRYRLVDHHGTPVTEQTYAGSFQLIFFGFTNCRLVCPARLSQLSQALDDLGSTARLVQALYITVDPERDDPTTMKNFLAERFPRFLGLTGDAAACAASQREFNVFSRRKEDPLDPSGYQIPHTALAHLIGPSGQYLDHFAEAVEREALVERLREMNLDKPALTAPDC